MLKLGDNNISSIKLGSTNVKSVYRGDTLIWPEPSILVYTTTSDNQSVRLAYGKTYFEYIETEDGVEDLSGSGDLYHTFVNAGEHKVKVLFKKGLITLDFCFNICTELTSIPEGLFANNPEVINFRFCFRGCTSLTSIPSNLFANNTKVINFSSCFRDCTSLTSSTPLDNDGTPLYNRSGGKEGYSVVNYSDGCFYKCTLMSDYSSIPSDWKNPPVRRDDNFNLIY